MSRNLLRALLESRGERLDEPIAWDAVTELAIREHVAPLLAAELEADTAVPSAVVVRLRRERYQTAAHNAVLYRELEALFERAPEAPPPVVLKGAALATTLYQDPSLRPMSDLDLLVRPEDVGTWSEALSGLGYVRTHPAMASGAAESAHFQIAFRSAHHQNVVELHWSLIGPASDWRAPEVAWFWDQTEPWNGVARPARMLTPLANVLYLSAHVMLQHGVAGAKLLWLYDLHLVVSSQAASMPWAEVLERAGAFEWDAPLAEALARAEALFGTPVPENVIETLRKRATSRAAVHVRHKANPGASRAGLVWREFLCLDAVGRWRLARGILFPHPDYMKWRYPKARALWPFTYLYRLGAALWEGVTALLTSALSFVALYI